MFPRYFGLRPDAPDVRPDEDIKKECRERHPDENSHDLRTACEQYLAHVVWAQQLAEAYRSRATMNEWAIYAAGIIALGGLSAVSGLGVAAVASAETLGLIGVSTGFTSALFGFMNNSRRAGFYTTAANDISSVLAKATELVGGRPDRDSYDAATKQLAVSVSKIANALETERYQAAADAAKAKQVQDALDRLKELETAQLVSLSPGHGKPDSEVVATIAGLDLSKYKDAGVRVFLDGESTSGEIKSKTEVKFKAAKVGDKKQVSVRLYVGGLPVPGERTFTYD